MNDPTSPPSLPATAQKNHSYLVIGLLTGLVVLTALLIPKLKGAQADGPVEDPVVWYDLLQGELTGWETYFGSPYQTVTLPGSDRSGRPHIGLNNDPLGVVSFVELEGEPTLRITGEVNGGISTTEDFQNYHLTLKYKWGGEIWPSPHGSVRDSGLCFHAHGEHGAAHNFWLSSVEFQIRQWATGDLWLNNTLAAVRAAEPKSADSNERMKIDFREPRRLVKGNVRCQDDVHEQYGWNKIDLYVLGDKAVFYVNGTFAMTAEDLSTTDGESSLPLTKGKIQLQSGGAEIFYQDIRIRELKEFPPAVQDMVDVSRI